MGVKNINNINVSKPDTKYSKVDIKEALELSGLPLVGMTIKDINNATKDLIFMVDTGADFNIIDKSALKGMMFEKAGHMRGVTTASGVNMKDGFNIVKLKIIDENNINEDNFTILDMSNAFDQIERESGMRVSGIIGSPFLSKHNMVIDFAYGRIY